jgi:RNA polymerase sigma-70 factor (ECF subfamily)
MFSIVHSIWIDEIRARQIRSRSRIEWSEELVETIADPGAADPETGMLHRQILDAVESLPDAQRVVMLLVAVEGLSYREAADTLEIPIGTVMSRLSRARLSIGAQFSAPPVNVAHERAAARKDSVT